MKLSLILALLLMTGIVFGQSAAQKKISDSYYQAQEKIFEAKAKILRSHGRLPIDFFDAAMILGQYGGHSSGLGSSFGAYSFYQPAFDQADRSWWIQGMMRAGSDLLVAVNRNAAFTGGTCNGWGSGSTREDGCFSWSYKPPQSPVGYSVGFIYKGPENAKVIEVVDKITLRLDKTSPSDVMQYDLSILPPDYVDLCACKMPVTTPDEMKNTRPCIQGGSLAPGASCSVTIGLGK